MSSEATGIPTKLKVREVSSERVVSVCLVISAAAAVVGFLFLGIFYSGVWMFGPLNDLMVIVQHLLMIPVMNHVHRILPASQRIKRIGFLGVGAVILLQSLLVVGVIPFQIQVLMVIPAFFVVASWFAAVEKLGSGEPRIPKGKWKAFFAGLVIGYPFWALDFRGRLSETSEIKPAEQEGER